MRPDSDAKKIWFCGDPHLLHPKIVAICNRPTTIEEHDMWIIDRINSVVGKHDDLFLLGDVSLGTKEKTEKLLDKIHGNKHLIAGNHDNNILHSTRFTEITQLKDFIFNSPIYPNVHIVLCHYPLVSWNRKPYGSMHLYSHVHDRYVHPDLAFDIGVDANEYFPLNLAQVLERMELLKLQMGDNMLAR